MDRLRRSWRLSPPDRNQAECRGCRSEDPGADHHRYPSQDNIMNLKRLVPLKHVLRAGAAIVSIAVLAACSGTNKPKPAELPANVAVLGVRQAWTAKLPAVTFPLQTDVSGDMLVVASADGTVVMLDSRSG